MRIDILTLFPDTMRAMLGESILGRAQARGLLDIRCHQIRDYTENRQKQVDDYPYGGGWGQVMMAQPLKSCLDAALADSTVPKARRRVIYLSPQGATFTQAKARQLKADYDQLVLVCGHYEGVDERFIEACVDEELSIGDFVLTGGELGAMVVTDCVCRMVPGVLSDTECYTGESHWAGRLDTRSTPAPRRGRAAPCRRCCAAATTRKLKPGALARVWSARSQSGPISFSRRPRRRTSSACSIRSGATAAARSL